MSTKTTYVARAQALSLYALALTGDMHAYHYQAEALTEPYVVIDQLVHLLVEATAPEARAELASKLQGFIAEATAELAKV